VGIGERDLPMTPTTMSNLVARAAKTTQWVCHWSDVINGTRTTPMM
jgi:hypothetical protein